MPRTITLHLDDNVHALFNEAALSEGRSLPKFIEYAVLSFLAKEDHGKDDKKFELVIDKKFIQNITRSLSNNKAIKQKASRKV